MFTNFEGENDHAKLSTDQANRTEEIYDDRACPVSDIDDDDDAIADDDDLEDAAPVRASRGNSQERASASGAETAGADSSDLTGEEDE